jgi:hypothetical protein
MKPDVNNNVAPAVPAASAVVVLFDLAGKTYPVMSRGIIGQRHQSQLPTL